MPRKRPRVSKRAKANVGSVALADAQTLSISGIPFIIRSNDSFDISAHVKIAFDLDSQWVARLYEIFEDHVYDMLVKNLYITKGIDVKLQAF
jgi:hypothetical protein